MKRREFLVTTSSALSATLVGCGSGSESVAATSSNVSGAPSPAPPPGPAPAPASASPGVSASGLPTLTVHPTAAGTFPYLATAYPLQGAVPNGQTIDSADDPTLSASVISRWPDGSAAVVVLAGSLAVESNTPRQVSLRATSKTSTPLPVARVGQLVQAINLSFGSVGSASLTNFDAPQLTWWSNSQVICCRYRVPIGGAGLEAVVDVHAFASDRAFVEVVIENGRINSAAPSAPSGKGYIGATVSVNGSIIATVSSPTVDMIGVGSYPSGDHERFRAWHTSTWVGGDPELVVVQDVESLQKHPLFWKMDQPSNQDFATAPQVVSGTLSYIYGSAAYKPWSIEAQRLSMSAGGDHESIGHLPKWDAQFLQTGDMSCRKAVIANALAALSFPISYRDATSGLIPTLDQTAGKCRTDGSWPEVPEGTGAGHLPYWDGEHAPAVGLMAFACRPSPVFIEIAQKAALHAMTWNTPDATLNKWWAARNVAWNLRNLAHAAFLTPTALPWRAAALKCLARNVAKLDAFRTSPPFPNPIGVYWPGAPSEAWDEETGFSLPGCQASVWMQVWMGVTLHRIDRAALLSGAPAAQVAALADWALSLPVRQVNESTGGEWRYQGIETTFGANDLGESYNSADPAAYRTWAAAFLAYRGAPPPAAGPWRGTYGHPAPRDYSDASNPVNPAANGGDYTSHFYGGLVAAVERSVAGADAAWDKVNANVTNLATWRLGFASDPRQGAYPRNK